MWAECTVAPIAQYVRYRTGSDTDPMDWDRHWDGLLHVNAEGDAVKKRRCSGFYFCFCCILIVAFSLLLFSWFLGFFMVMTLLATTASDGVVGWFVLVGSWSTFFPF